jgi:hypothetical protein
MMDMYDRLFILVCLAVLSIAQARMLMNNELERILKSWPDIRVLSQHFHGGT